MNSRRSPLAFTLLCSLLFMPLCHAAETTELEQVLPSFVWSWNNPKSAKNGWGEGATMRFSPDGKLIQTSTKGKTAVFDWRIEGPRTVVFGPKDGMRRVEFDDSISSYKAAEVWNGNDTITGIRKQPITATIPSPAPQQHPINPTAALTLDTNQPLLDTFSQLAPNASAWVLAALDEGVPPNVRQNLTYLREDLLDEYKQKPKASQDAYKVAHQLCSTMIAALDERDQTLVRAGFRAVQADANATLSGNQALNARRNYMMSWPQYAREQSQRAELRSEASNKSQVMKEQPKVEWSTRTAALRRTLDDLYAKFREALRQSVK
ncbi:MAG: hypothetical protein ACKVY0_18890 [Prosthecobacter sp.]|uniref:hypothetical protein n=1 Tax=Prosthecobacter sp. TaxID=1965333 RepID=UPI0038FE9EA0